MAKRKPPSQRPELKKDETARAIARLREEAKPEKTSKSARLASDDLKSRLGHDAGGVGPRKPGQTGPASTVRQRKTGGG